jgi:hypothetical protein
MVLPLKPALPILAIPIGDFHNKIGTKQTCRGEFAHARFRSEADMPLASRAGRSDAIDPERKSIALANE